MSTYEELKIEISDYVAEAEQKVKCNSRVATFAHIEASSDAEDIPDIDWDVSLEFVCGGSEGPCQ